MSRVKGTNLVHAVSYAKSRGGAEAWERVVSALSPEDQAAVRALVAVGWYDLGLQLRLFRALDATLGHGDLGLVGPLARFEAEQDLTRIHRLFLRLANPAYVLEKSGEYWHRFYDAGEWTVRRDGDTRATGTLVGFDANDPAFCLYLTRYIERMFELVGAKGVNVEHPRCRSRGSEACDFSGSWRA